MICASLGLGLGVEDNRKTKYIISGENAKRVNLQTANNTDGTICSTKIQPDSNDDIAVTVTTGK